MYSHGEDCRCRSCYARIQQEMAGPIDTDLIAAATLMASIIAADDPDVCDFESRAALSWVYLDALKQTRGARIVPTATKENPGRPPEEASKMKRYDMAYDHESREVWPVESPYNGEWVKWEDADSKKKALISVFTQVISILTDALVNQNEKTLEDKVVEPLE